MKRPGKCVGKKTFQYFDDAERQVIKNYIYRLKSYGIYECPTCLDFHLTSKYDNRSDELKRFCRKARSLSYAISDPIKATEKAQKKWKRPVMVVEKKKPTPPKIKPKTVFSGSVAEKLQAYAPVQKSLWQRLWDAIMAK